MRSGRRRSKAPATPSAGCSRSTPPARAKRNVQRHYDLSGEFYRLFLDEDMQYSCAYFERPDMTLEEAQAAKKRHIAAKLKMEPGQSVLDIGSGWGGLGLYLARTFEAEVLGVTLSTEQHAVATERAQSEGLDNHVHFEIRDYRDLSERFDRIVSVGMFEHVGINHYRTFFDKCATLLKPDGVMLLHTIGRSGPPAATSAFIRKYIFPGGYIPALSEVMPAIEKSGLVMSRRRGPAAALCRHAEALARTLPRQPRPGAGDLRRALLPHVGVLPRRLRSGVPLAGSGGFPDPADAQERHAADHARLHRKVREGAGHARAAGARRTEEGQEPAPRRRKVAK